MDIFEVIDHLDRVPAAERSKSLMASVRTDQLLLTDESGDVALDLPKGKSYIIDEKTRTFDNGFVGFWMSRGISGTIEISSDSQSGSADFSTKQDGATCITDFQLS